jgi:hypothetical protein
MPITKVGIIYSKSQNLRRKVIIPEVDDSEVDIHKNYLLPGEAWMEIPMDVYTQYDHPTDVDAFVSIQLNSAEPMNDWCLVVDANSIILACIPADPIIDDHPLGHIICDAPAMVGDMYNFETASVVINPDSPARKSQ